MPHTIGRRHPLARSPPHVPISPLPPPSLLAQLACSHAHHPHHLLARQAVPPPTLANSPTPPPGRPLHTRPGAGCATHQPHHHLFEREPSCCRAWVQATAAGTAATAAAAGCRRAATVDGICMALVVVRVADTASISWAPGAHTACIRAAAGLFWFACYTLPRVHICVGYSIHCMSHPLPVQPIIS